MVIVGELINTTRKSVKAAVVDRDEAKIRELARNQAEAGANYIDVNAGTLGDQEIDSLVWLVETVQDEVEVPLCVDSPDPKALDAGLAACKSRALLNSITAEPDRLDPTQRTGNIGVDEYLGLFNRAIDVTFGCEINDCVDPVLIYKLLNQRPVTDISLDELVVGVTLVLRKILQVAGVRELVQINHKAVVVLREHHPDKIAPNEACATCNQKLSSSHS